jgi:hypothetical protein
VPIRSRAVFGPERNCCRAGWPWIMSGRPGSYDANSIRQGARPPVGPCRPHQYLGKHDQQGNRYQPQNLSLRPLLLDRRRRATGSFMCGLYTLPELIRQPRAPSRNKSSSRRRPA